MEFLAQLQNPPREFTAIPFWFLNGNLTDAELRRQLADFTAHGIYGVVLHPRMGLSPDITYLGERYFAHIRTAVEAAAALDMKIVLYDEGMYPSGSACGLVVKDHPELASEGITLTQTVLPGDELLAQAENGALVVRKSGGTMRGLHWGEDDGEKKAPKTADILNPAAVSRFIELTHEAYYRELKAYFGTRSSAFLPMNRAFWGATSAVCSRGRTALPRFSAVRAATPPTSLPCLTAGKTTIHGCITSCFCSARARSTTARSPAGARRTASV